MLAEGAEDFLDAGLGGRVACVESVGQLLQQPALRSEALVARRRQVVLGRLRNSLGIERARDVGDAGADSGEIACRNEDEAVVVGFGKLELGVSHNGYSFST